MIINPIVAAAAVAARAVGNIFPGDWVERHTSRQHPANYYSQQRHGLDDDYEPCLFSNESPNADRRYLLDIEDDLYHQSREFDDFAMTPTPFIFQDAEILSKETTKQAASTSNRRPPLLHTTNPWKLLGIDNGASFDDIRRAYKEMTKMYHPDVVVGPDATAEERRDANEDFARINAAFEFLKRKESEEIYEYHMYIDGERVTRSVAVVPSEYQQTDPYRINYDRIMEMSEYRKHHPQAKTWYEAENDYHQRHNGFATHSAGTHSKGRWWHTRGFAQRNNDVGTIPRKDNRNHDAQKQRASTSSGGFRVHQNPNRWWNGMPSLGHEGPNNNNHDYQLRKNDRFVTSNNYSHSYKETVGSEFTSSFAEVSHHPTDFDELNHDDHQENSPLRDKWWKGNECVFREFSP